MAEYKQLVHESDVELETAYQDFEKEMAVIDQETDAVFANASKELDQAELADARTTICQS